MLNARVANFSEKLATLCNPKKFNFSQKLNFFASTPDAIEFAQNVSL